MRLPNYLKHLPKHKRAFSQALVESIASIPDVVSTTIVGSFRTKPGLEGISDIDTIVVCKSLKRDVFEEIVCVAKNSAKPSLLGLSDHKLVINSTFGPLKFDNDNCIVLHLMIYDIEGHKRHVLESPFTCFDWERSPVYLGKSLSEIYPVLKLLPTHFKGARRGLQDYLNDINKGSLSFREYRFIDSEGYEEKKRSFQLDERHKGEYAYHIIKNLLSNYSKLITGKNKALDTEALCAFWKEHIPHTAGHTEEYRVICEKKANRETIFPEEAVSIAKALINSFSEKFSEEWDDSRHSLFLVRHGPTTLNDGSFLGQRRNPPLERFPSSCNIDCSRVFSSPLLRAKQTAASFFPLSKIDEDERLLEINYGDAEGLRFQDLVSDFPEIVASWEDRQDPPFPSGEATSQVKERILSFFASQKDAKGPIWAFTHNVVIRTAIGYHLSIPCHQWHHIPVDHLDPIEFLRYDGSFYLNLSKMQRARITDQLVNHAQT